MHLQLYMYGDKRKGDRTTQFASKNQNMGDRRRHCGIDVNIVDPDKGNSLLCSACKLPIFATPFIGDGGSGAVLHDQCANLPEVLKGCELHPEKPLLLRDNHHQESCRECSEKCGSKLYYCPDSECGLILDVACALPVKVLHRSHLQHRLVGVRKSSLGTCGVCRATHEAAVEEEKEEAEGRSYFCNVCGFWIHPECARLPNVIQHENHKHPLLLYYDFLATIGVYLGSERGTFSLKRTIMRLLTQAQRRVCAICEHEDMKMRGIYYCIKCEYSIHIRCAISNSRSFHAVLSGEARLPGLVHLPLPDEYQSFVGYARGNASIKFESITTHDHPLILHKNEDENAGVCDACVKVINKPPFYSCTVCPNFFLHHYCYHNLPGSFFLHPAHNPIRHRKLVFNRRGALDGSICHHCRCPTLREYYECERCQLRFDVSCAIMPGFVTHDAHATSHFLRLTDRSPDRSCHCCSRSLGKLGYECQTCPNFALHTWCAMLPKTVTHKFDPHPLRLITGGDGVAEICENCMKNKVWHYGCKECDQWFHIDCIPCLDLVSKMKSLADSGMNINVPSRLIRGLTLQGHGDDYCTKVADEYDTLLSD